MATGNFFAAFSYELWVATGTTSSTAPTTTSGLTQIFSVTNASIQGTSDTVDVLDYGSSFGYKTSLVTGQSYTIPVTLNLDTSDAGYKLIKTASFAASSGTTLRWYRKTPVTNGTVNSNEYHAGVAFVGSFQESLEAGGIATVSFDLVGVGAPTWTAQGTGTGT